MRLTKDESEINLANGEVEPEFADWKWARPEEVIEQVLFSMPFPLRFSVPFVFIVAYQGRL